MEMKVTELDGPVTRVALHGRLDAVGADSLGLPFTSHVVSVGRDAVVDLSGVTFVASLGLRLLITSARALNGKGCKLALFGANELVQGLFEDAALDQILTITKTEGEALAAIGH
jgi:anti-anti-sigma factor